MKRFHDNWNIDTPDLEFAGMLKSCVQDGTDTLLNSAPLADLLHDEEENEETAEKSDLQSSEHSAYTKSDFLSDVYVTELQYDRMVSVLKHKMNIILQGAPGVGKTLTQTSTKRMHDLMIRRKLSFSFSCFVMAV